DAKLRPAKASGELPAMEAPRSIGEGNLFAVDRAGDGQRRGPRRGPGLVEVVRNRRLEISHGVVVDHEDALGPPRRIGEGKTAFPAADVADQSVTHTCEPATDNDLVANRLPPGQDGTFPHCRKDC